eukprot:2847012-Karenia_brevis.AAC.1
MDDQFPLDDRIDTFAKYLAVHKDINKIFADLGATPPPLQREDRYCLIPKGFEIDTRDNIREDDIY